MVNKRENFDYMLICLNMEDLGRLNLNVTGAKR